MISSTTRARDLRRQAPVAERLVWSRLRNRRLGGFKFVRQWPVGPYFADFACRERSLIVEIDGATHSLDEERWHDARRSEALRVAGYHVLRFTNDAVYTNLDGVMETVLCWLERRDWI